MPNGYDVLTGELAGHAGRLDALQDRLDQALQAASSVHMGTEAYGVICQFFVPIVHAVSGPGVEAIRQAAESVTDTSQGIRDNTTSYDNVEQANTKPFAGGAR
ncbi:Excreted virulence factor EspC, type VII ESX diderm [Actinokineospora alba]|uniref:Excreted virulence factor EspC, type VII ESX diderm n=1 Tax=Actinokineospora alba TaxID=504798 RepID=A0A1H0Q099_9PSEU|nr:type VII secretion target [Actinokineospora alba]TDP66019.1 excreted virulence factor EspC (type VII ESX diderm) [Actinokineospora alba]SDI59880.1 Excreted virulence factor EspC, type VII ESX diderm [Actinokineospora alba]SDP10851.1 Excreted virulence factor EspC, type VII ESX diderm [Actinokineospora alba]